MSFYIVQKAYHYSGKEDNYSTKTLIGGFKVKLGDVVNFEFEDQPEQRLLRLALKNVDNRLVEVMLGVGILRDATEEYMFILGGPFIPKSFDFILEVETGKGPEQTHVGEDWIVCNKVFWPLQDGFLELNLMKRVR